MLITAGLFEEVFENIQETMGYFIGLGREVICEV